LNAEPGALAALPGVTGEASQDWFGWPVVPGLSARARLDPVNMSAVEAAILSKHLRTIGCPP